MEGGRAVELVPVDPVQTGGGQCCILLSRRRWRRYMGDSEQASTSFLIKGTHARDFIVRFSQFFGIIQEQTRPRPRIKKILLDKC